MRLLNEVGGEGKGRRIVSARMLWVPGFRTVLMSGSGAAAVFGPGISHVSMMCGDNTADLVQLPGRESAMAGSSARGRRVRHVRRGPPVPFTW
jgi:hypothetical protein